MTKNHITPTQYEWRPIDGYEGLYEVGSHGRVRSLDRLVVGPGGHPKRLRGKELSPGRTTKGYNFVFLYKVGVGKSFLLHQLVASAFLPANDGKELNHKDYDKSNNAACNLEWLTHLENVRHSLIAGRAHNATSAATVAKIRQRRDEGATYEELSSEFNLSRATLHKVVYGKGWFALIPKSVV